MHYGPGHLWFRLCSSGCVFCLFFTVFLSARNFSLSRVMVMPLTGDAKECMDSNGESACPFHGARLRAIRS